jgi:TPR repeat protein
MRLVFLAFAALLTLTLGDAAFADTIDDGVDAAIAGDFDTALVLLGVGVNRGDARAEFFLGIMYEAGTGVPKDAHEAANLYRQSADQGLAPAQNNLASLYANGDGVAQNDDEAMRLWLLAADQGLPVAQANLASSYATGTYVTKDLVQAYKWSALSAAQGYRDGADILDVVRMIISPQDRQSAERLIRAWRPVVTRGA